MKEPIRLCDGDELPVSLRDAFRALEREAPSADVIARVQHTLQALPAATPGAAAVSALSAGKVLVLSTLIVGTVASLVALRSAPAGISATPRRQALAVVEAPVVDLPAPLAADSAASPAHTPPVESAARADTADAPIRSPRQELPEARAGRRVAAQSSTRRPANSRAGYGESAARATPIATPTPTAAPQELALPAEPAPSAPDPDTAGAQASEARMLAQAKRLATREPEAALRQLQALSAQFPVGLFVQERELLAIQLHRQLGHAALVEQLTRQFQERYPRSLYRRALPP